MSGAVQADQETTDIREAHRFDVKRLEAFCREAVEGFGGDLEVRQGRRRGPCASSFASASVPTAAASATSSPGISTITPRSL